MTDKDDRRRNFLRQIEHAVKYLRGAKLEDKDAFLAMTFIAITLQSILRELKETDDDVTRAQRRILSHLSDAFSQGQIEITNRSRRRDFFIALHVAATKRQPGDFASVVVSTAEHFGVSESTVARALRKHREVLDAGEKRRSARCQK
jgi:hypothetical protein